MMFTRAVKMKLQCLVSLPSYCDVISRLQIFLDRVTIVDLTNQARARIVKNEFRQVGIDCAGKIDRRLIFAGRARSEFSGQIAPVFR